MIAVDTSAWIEWLTESATGGAIMLATVRAKGATVLSCDGHFAGLSGVTLIEKVKD